MDALLALTNIAVVLLLGVVFTIIAKKLEISDVLLLILLGILLARLAFNGRMLFAFDDSFLVGLGVLAFIMVVFDSASRFRVKKQSTYSPLAFKLTGFFVLFSILLLPLFTTLLFFGKITLMNILLSLILAVIVVGTDLDSVFVMLKDCIGPRAKKLFGLLHTEAILSTGLVVIIPFIIIDIINDVWLWQEGILPFFWNQIALLLLQLIVGFGAGVVVGIIVLKALQKFYHHHFSPVSLLVGVLVAYLLAENLGGNGALAVVALGFLFGSFYVKEKPKLQEFSSMLSNALEILIFILLGFMIKIPLTLPFFVNSLILFALLVVARLGAVFMTLKKGFSLREKFFVGLNMPKGIAVAIIIFMLALYNYAPFTLILQLLLALIVYSLILSTIIDKFSKKFVKKA